VFWKLEAQFRFQPYRARHLLVKGALDASKTRPTKVLQEAGVWRALGMLEVFSAHPDSHVRFLLLPSPPAVLFLAACRRQPVV
jgi:hypothetical protein